MFMTTKQAAEKWGLSDRRVRILCTDGKIPGAFQEGRGWKIPADAVKPTDGRFKSTESLLNMIDQKKAELDTCRPLTEGEVARLIEEFTVEYTFNSKHISLTVTSDQVQCASDTDGLFIKVNGKDIVSNKIGFLGDALRSSESITFREAFFSANILPNLENTMDCEARAAAGGVDDFVLGSGVHHLDTHINDISRSKILAFFTLLRFAHQILKGIIHDIKIVIEELNVL